ncbi:MAG: bifunctional folylpolyglutamate synthase/dihydrofolate synthase [Verrucomicrobia bacterium]|nr:bifunctional folylpolyglutamate synthase/dihydrofolate synthase [Verrucomicrobiota bacterium]
MTYAEALDHLHGLAVFGARFGLETAHRMAAGLGNPQEQLRFIHVAGTNGKGSTCAMLESIYRAAGLRVGLFTSPHLVSFRERIQVNRRLISETEVARLVEEVISSQCLVVSERGDGLASAFSTQSLITNYSPPPPPTLFEFVTVMALKYFAEQKCDVVIWETGLGGRLDATNIVTPLASVITNIALDHQQWLGETLPKIAAEKAGIIKPGVPVLTAADAPEAVAVIRAESERKGAAFTLVGGAGSSDRDDCGTGAAGTAAPPVLPLRGAHQRRNAGLAVAVVRALQATLPVGETALRHGLESVQWAGRLQMAKVGGREFLFDGAHNADGVRALAAALRGEFGGQPFALALGMLGDKDCELMCSTLAPLAVRIAAVRVASNRTTEPAVLAGHCRRANPTALVTAHESLKDALAALEAEPRVVIAGSLYLIGEALERLGLDVTAGERGLNEWQRAGMKR